MESSLLARSVGFQFWLAGLASSLVEILSPPAEVRNYRQLRLLDEMIANAGDRFDEHVVS